MVLPALTPRFDYAVYGIVQALAGSRDAPVSRCWELVEHIGQWRRESLEHFEHVREGLADFGGFSLDVGVKQRLGHNPQSQAHHLLSDVDRLPLAPAIPGPGRIF